MADFVTTNVLDWETAALIVMYKGYNVADPNNAAVLLDGDSIRPCIKRLTKHRGSLAEHSRL